MWDYFDGLSAGEFWTDFGDVALRAFLSIVVLFILTKLMGNKHKVTKKKVFSCLFRQ